MSKLKAISLWHLMLVGLLFPFCGAGQGFLWARQIGMVGSVLGLKTAADANGNVYVAGSFQQTANFGLTNLSSFGGQDVFVAKYDALGNLIWVTQAGGTGYDIATDVAVDANGYAYVTGTYQGPAQFGSFTLSKSNTMFIAKFRPDGLVVWAKETTGSASNAGIPQTPGSTAGVAVDSLGNVYSAGSVGASAVLVDKRDSMGNLLWHRVFPGGYQTCGNGIKVDNHGNVYVAGQFSGTVDFDGITVSCSYLMTVFLAKFDSNGYCVWAQEANAGGKAAANSVGLDSSGAAYITGQFEVGIQFGTNLLTTPTACNGYPDAFVAKYDSNGSFIWVNHLTRNGVNSGSSIAVDAQGSSYVTGVLNPAQAFLSKYDSNGASIWEIEPGNAATSGGYGATIDPYGHAYFTIWGSSDMSFDSFGFTSLQGGDLFVTKVSEQIPPVIQIQPTSSAPGFLFGRDYSFTVSVRSIYPVSYQWTFDGTNINGATGSVLSITNAQLSDQGNYAVVASNFYGSSTSSVAQLTVYFTVGTAVNGSGGVSTDPPSSSFAGNSTMSLTAITNAGNPFIGWSGDVSATTNPLTLVITSNINVIASFADSVTNIVIDYGDPRATFAGLWSSTDSFLPYGLNYYFAENGTADTATAVYRPNIVVPGYYDVSVWCPEPWKGASPGLWSVTYPGGTIITNITVPWYFSGWLLIAPGVYFDQGTNGFVSLSNVSVQSNSIATADAVRFLPSVSVSIAWNPQPQSIKAGGTAWFSVWASGTPPFSYQWQRDGVALAGATSSSLTLYQVQPSSAGNYSVIVSNILGIGISLGASLSVAPPSAPALKSLSIASNQQIQMILSGDPGVVFSIEASSNLVDWVSINTVTNITGSVSFSDNSDANSNSRFYRAKWLPQ